MKKRLGTGLVAIKTEETLLVGTVEDKHVFKKAEKIMATVAEKLAESGF